MKRIVEYKKEGKKRTMQKKIYKIELTGTSSMQIEQAQTTFMSAVFKKAEESGIVGARD